MFSDYLVYEWSPSTAPLATPSWVDITGHVIEASVARGFGSLVEPFSSARGQVRVRNVTSWLDPAVGVKWRPFRIRAADESFTVFAGYVSGVNHDLGQQPQVKYATFQLTDALGLFAAAVVGDVDEWFGDTPIGEVYEATFTKPGWVTSAGASEAALFALNTVILPVFSSSSYAFAHCPVFVESDASGNALGFLRDYLLATGERIEVTTEGAPLFQHRWKRIIDYLAASPDSFDDHGGRRILRGNLDVADPREYFNTVEVTPISGGVRRAGTVPTDWPVSAWTLNSQIVDPCWAQASADLVSQLCGVTDTAPQSIEVLLAGPTATTVDATHPFLEASLPVVDVDVGGDAWTVAVLTLEHRIDLTGWRATAQLGSLEGVAAIAAASPGGLFQLGTSTFGDGVLFAP